MEILAAVGAVIFSVGWVWLAITAFQKGGWIWGAGVILFNWVSGLVFCIVYKTGWLQYLVFMIGSLLLVAGLQSERIIRLFR